MNRPAIMAIAAFVLMPHQAAAQAHQPYSGLEARSIKALSDQQVSDLRAGRGMGLALAAELNGYPGPLHVLELSDALGLSESQRAEMQRLLETMKAESIPLGERLIAEENMLDRKFADKTITEAGLRASTDSIGAIQGSLRAAHLKYHLATVNILTTAQVARYASLRGYSSTPSPHHPPGGHHR